MSTTEETKAIEYRLYQYNTGQLQKVGKGKTGPRPHSFNDFVACVQHVCFLRNKYKGHEKTQFVVVEWFGPYDDRIHVIL
jgi:hypothetical protein